MSITRWDPWGEMISLRDAMNNLLTESFVRPRGQGESGGNLALDVHEQGDNYVITAPVPGMNPDQVEITVLGDMLRIRGERQDNQERQGDDRRWLMREQRYGAFERTIRLPSTVKADAAKAEFDNGLLTITLPKAEEAKEKRIPVQAGQGQREGQGQEIPVETGGDGKAEQRQAKANQQHQTQQPEQQPQAQQQ